MSDLCGLSFKDDSQCPNPRAADAPMCGKHLMEWVQRLTEALRRDHNLIYAMLLKHGDLQRESDFWPTFYDGGGLMNASEGRLRDFEKGVFW